MLAMMAHALPRLGVDEVKGRAALRGDALVTDEVMRRVEDGVPFRQAYRTVAEEFKRGVIFTTPTVADLIRRRRTTGNLGNIGVAALRGRVRAGRQWNRRERTRFDRAMNRLGGRLR